MATDDLRSRIDRARTAARRLVLRRRRLLAAFAAAVAVLAGLAAAAPSPAATVRVAVAAVDLEAGAVIEPTDLVEVDLPPDGVPDGLAPSPAGRTLAAPLRRGEAVTDVRLVGPSLLAGYPGLSAVPVRLPDAGVVALLRAGDRVDLVAADPQGAPARTVATDVPVLALPLTGDETDDVPPGRLVVLGVDDAEVAAVADAASRLFLTVVWSR